MHLRVGVPGVHGCRRQFWTDDEFVEEEKPAGGTKTRRVTTRRRRVVRARIKRAGRERTFKIGNDTNQDKEDDTDEEEEEEEKTKTSNDSPKRHGGRGVQNACSIGNIARAIFRDIREKKKGLSEQDLVALECIFGETNLGRALDVASSRGGVTRFIGKKSRRTVYAVKATTTTTTTMVVVVVVV